ncbi:NeuD/PglB/VioB family sugar acetyltransferase [Dietzia maris]|uniref:NeuD/PglB/VioB family sugar acetyltransferase n=1 Tax=Dietzia maris TaxID=37915 RepID=UPI0022B31014|nr:NeuD/PglB/VioB family sugar acetyltransferase [Dietzia maris]MCZ4541824.1 NeuD/PglB/VioB family sugar acetyltransferase [Dietzia maris]
MDGRLTVNSVSSNRDTLGASIVIIVGVGGHGREVLGVLRRTGRSFEGFVDDTVPDAEMLDRIQARYLGAPSLYSRNAPGCFVIGIGSGHVRERVREEYFNDWFAPVLVDPTAVLDGDVNLSAGAIVFAHATVTTNITVGVHSHIGRGAAIGHDCTIGQYVTVMPMASVSGDVRIGNGATIGAGSVIRQGQVIGAGAYVGAGAVVVNDIPAGATVVGNPARTLRREDKESNKD